VFYCSDAPKAAAAETVFYRMHVPCGIATGAVSHQSGEFMAFAVQLKTKAALDLTEKPFAKDVRRTALSDYSACLTLADAARACGTG
jgi:hypothetical protein